MKQNAMKFVVFCLIGILAVGMVSALPITVDKLKVNGDEISAGTTTIPLDIIRGEDLSVDVYLHSSVSLENIDMQVRISGNRYDDIADTAKFDIEANKTYKKTFELSIPSDTDEKNYDVRIIATDATGTLFTQSYRIAVDVEENLVEIRDVVLSPSSQIQQGKGLFGKVRIKNAGDNQEDVKVIMSIPRLGLQDAVYVDSLDKEDTVSSEELFLKIPDCAPVGRYDVKVEAVYNNGRSKESATQTMEVIGSDACQITPTEGAVAPSAGRTVITVGVDNQQVKAGEGGVVYPITLTNEGTSAKSYSLTVEGLNGWGTSQVTPSNVVVLQGGETKTAYVYVSANEDVQAGDRMFTVTVSSGSDALRQIALKASVVAGSANWGGVKKALEIGLIVLVVLLVILGLIIGFNKLKGNDDEEEDNEVSGQTYY